MKLESHADRAVNLPEVVLQVDRLKKVIGKKTIVENVSFTVREGEIFGFLGPNGAGKTTTIRMLVDLIRPTEGSVSICGHQVHRNPELALSYVGSIVENPEVYSYLTGYENLEQFARMQPGISKERLKEVIALVGLDARIHDKVKTYSLGMRQRLGIAQALLGAPRLLILDEPTNGLDPKGIKELRQFIRSLADQGMAVVVSSHLLSEIQLMCDRVAIISRGKVLASGPVADLIQNSSSYVAWQLVPRMRGEEVLRALGCQLIEHPGEVLDDALLTGSMEGSILTEMRQEEIQELIPQLVKAGIQIQGAHKINPTLEQLFLEMTERESIE
ncbi:bacitracin ABC transporter ATP-binding protein [Paenibacillus antibioticophila]|uniref:Bacitracin ABC transporter ATP-binding protein n=1 Tax=Paenibacillus antibioticophila TaxID=1274374 RepID=A0A920CHG6_9BACL|nr:ABC transporter ATP-binding protein [Paenibacillus antibioticophila]GIO36732.1 bacitracin ABC transporter ATP-binding protein [Paenibacillus antibioticophila]